MGRIEDQAESACITHRYWRAPVRNIVTTNELSDERLENKLKPRTHGVF